MLTVMANDIERLGRYVTARRKDLGLSQIEVWHAGGPSNSTLTGIENGTAQSLSPLTIRKLDSALRWEPGSARAVLRGGEPRTLDLNLAPDPDVVRTVKDERGVRYSFKTYQIPPNQIAELMSLGSVLDATIDDFEAGEGSAEDVVRAARALRSASAAAAVSYYGGSDQIRQVAQAFLHAAEMANHHMEDPEVHGDSTP